MALLLLLPCALLLAFADGSDAKDFLVGGRSGGWMVPAQPDALNKWAEARRFHVGDNLVFKFNGAVDSVLEVTLDDYNRCSTASPVAAYKASDAKVPLPRTGPHFFVSGAPGSCQKGERLVVVVMSDHGPRSPVLAPPTPAPTAADPIKTPVPAPGLVKTPAPVASPGPPAPTAADLVKTPAPAPAKGAAAGRTAGALALSSALLGAAVVVGF